MRLTTEILALGMHLDTLNKAQFELLNQPYPPQEDWQKKALTQELTVPKLNLFLLLRGKLASTAQKQIIKNYALLSEFHSQKTKEASPKVESSSSTLEIYCDGACSGNPGKAGSGLAIYGGGKPILLYGDYNHRGTNNTAELNALYKALLIAKESAKEVTILSDSKYSIDCITLWAYSWKRNGWKKKGGEIKNLDIIRLSHGLYEEIKGNITIKHVKGHSGVEGNELADRMALRAIESQSSEYKEYNYSSIGEILS
jgi:ribonuclease HI